MIPDVPYPADQLKGVLDLATARREALPSNVGFCLAMARMGMYRGCPHYAWHAVESALVILLRRTWLDHSGKNSPIEDPVVLAVKLCSAGVISSECRDRIRGLLTVPDGKPVEVVAGFYVEVVKIANEAGLSLEP